MPVAFRSLWTTVPAGVIQVTQLNTRQLAVMRAETVGAANAIHWTHTGTLDVTQGILVGWSIPPWVNVITGDRIAGGWGQYGRYGPIIIANGAGSDQDVHFWESELSGAGTFWNTTVFNAGIDADGSVRGHSRGRQFNAFAIACPGAVIDV
jgi:hypothetical protein